MQSGDHFRFWWVPHTEYVTTWTASRTTLPNTDPENPAIAWVRDRLIGFTGLEQLYAAAIGRPGMVKSINRAFQATLLSRVTEVIDRGDRVFTFDCLFKQHVSEWAVPIERTKDFVLGLRDMIEAKGYEAHFPVEVRFVDADDLWLSPAYGRKVCYVGIIAYRPLGLETDYKPFFADFEVLAKAHGGRPHWAKPHGMTAADMRASYPRFDDVLRLRDRMDPVPRVFANELVEQALGK